MMDLEALAQDLMRDEWLEFLAYRDSNDRWTIGVGHLLDPDPKVAVPRVSRITAEEARAWLECLDIPVAVAVARRVFPGFDQLNGARQRALVNMAFNRGERRLRESTEITPAVNAAIASGDWTKVKAAIEGTPWALEVKDRAGRLATMLETGMVA